MKRKISYVCLLCLLLIFGWSSIVYGAEIYVENDFVCDSLDDYVVITDIIIEELTKIDKGNTLKIRFAYDVESIYPNGYSVYSIDELKVICKKDISNLNHNVIERLDGVLSVTPAVGVGCLISNSGCYIYFYVTEHDLSSEVYVNEKNSLINFGKTLKNDYEKIHYLGNYFYKNGFEYAYDNSNEYKSSKSIENPNCMPDSVLSRKKAICMGFANVAAEYLTGLNIPNIKVRGYSVEDGGYHVWNMVYLNINGITDWYCVDYGCSIHREYNKRLIKTKELYGAEYTWDVNLEKDILKLKYNNQEVKGLYNIFKDISGHWAENEILSAYENSFVNGYQDGTFRPNANISIAEFLQVAVASYVSEEQRPNVEYWWDGAYNFALLNGVITTDLFPVSSVSESITREQMAYILINLDNLFNTKVYANENISVSIPDDGDISESYKNQVYQAYQRGVMQGVNKEGVFCPSNLATRAQAVVILCRIKGL